MVPDSSPAGSRAGGFEQDLQRKVGRAIRPRRLLVEMSQQKLAARCGVSFQQIQKYEAGEASVYAARLWAISRALGVSVSYFFEGARTDSPSGA